MTVNGLSFSVGSYAAWAPRVESKEAWQAWAEADKVISGGIEPPLRLMPPLLRRRAGFPGKMALEVAYRCLGVRVDVPIIFSSRHGEASRSVDLLMEVAKDAPPSPTSFCLSVHNATGGLFSIARADHAASSALAAGETSVEHAAIEACGLLADGEPAVLLVAYDCPLPPLYSAFEDCREQPFAWAWLMQAPMHEVISLTWSGVLEEDPPSAARMPPGLEILRFYLRQDSALERVSGRRRWTWSRHA